MFIAKNQVRMHDTDMAGVLYFARQFRYAHDALEDFVASEGFSFNKVFHEEDFVFVIVHCEADYYAPLAVGDTLEVKLTIEKVGNTSFTINYDIFCKDQRVGNAKTTHVTLKRSTREKLPLPPHFRASLEKHLS